VHVRVCLLHEKVVDHGVVGAHRCGRHASRRRLRTGLGPGGQIQTEVVKGWARASSFCSLSCAPEHRQPTGPNDGDSPARREGALRASGVVAHCCESRAASVTLSATPPPPHPTPPLPTPAMPLSSVQGRPTRPQSQPRCDPLVRGERSTIIFCLTPPRPRAHSPL
jgi:hypothetical protein